MSFRRQKDVFSLLDQIPEKATIQKTLPHCKKKTSFRRIDFLFKAALIRESSPNTPKYSYGSCGGGRPSPGPSPGI
jgi:hypothetical protein